MCKDKNLSFAAHRLCQFICCFFCRLGVICRYRCHQSLIITSAVICHDRDLIVCRHIKLYFTGLLIGYGNCKCRRLSRQFFVQKIHLLVYIVRIRRCIESYFHFIFACIAQILIDIISGFLYTFLYFAPVLTGTRLTYNRNISSFFQF